MECQARRAAKILGVLVVRLGITSDAGFGLPKSALLLEDVGEPNPEPA